MTNRLTDLEAEILKAAVQFGRTENEKAGVAHKKTLARLGRLYSLKGPEADPNDAKFKPTVMV